MVNFSDSISLFNIFLPNFSLHTCYCNILVSFIWKKTENYSESFTVFPIKYCNTLLKFKML